MTRCAAALAVLAASSCTPIVKLTIYNAGTQAVRWYRDGEVLTIAPSSRRSFRWLAGSGGDAFACLGEAQLRYKVRFPPPDRFVARGIRLYVRLQIDGDGRAWAPARDEAFPLASGAPQPEGFPLVPEPDGPCTL